jgi:hypothetical protein
MPGIRARLDRMRSRLGPEPSAEHSIVRIGPPGLPVERYGAGLIGCTISEPTPELAETLLGLDSLGVFGAVLGMNSGMEPDEEAELRRLILASVVDNRHRGILAGVPAWDVVWESWEMERWATRPGPREEASEPA